MKNAILPNPKVRKERPCGSCTMCCKLIGIGEPVNSPSGSWCKECEIGSGCKIYESRPEECRTFYCGWKYGIGETRPDKSKVVIGVTDSKNAMIFVDVGRSDELKKPEFRQIIEAFRRKKVENLTIVCGSKRQTLKLKKPLEDQLRSTI